MVQTTVYTFTFTIKILKQKYCIRQYLVHLKIDSIWYPVLYLYYRVIQFLLHE